MKAIVTLLSLLSLTVTAAADYGMQVNATSVLCTGVSADKTTSSITMNLTPISNSKNYTGTYKIDSEKSVSLAMAPLSLQSEGSILIQTYGKFAAGNDDYLNLMVSGNDSEVLVRDLKAGELKPVYQFTGVISLRRVSEFKVSCLASFAK